MNDNEFIVKCVNGRRDSCSTASRLLTRIQFFKEIETTFIAPNLFYVGVALLTPKQPPIGSPKKIVVGTLN